MLTLTGNGRLTRDVELRSTRSSESVATISVASDRRDRSGDPVYVDLILWRGQAEAAARHRQGPGGRVLRALRAAPVHHKDGREGVAYELHDVALEYGAKPRRDEPAAATAAVDPEDIPF